MREKQAYEILEDELEKWCGWPVAVCSSGTAALHLALEALQLPRGSQVLVPEFTMIACARAVVMAGLQPVFVDCGDDLLMNLDGFEATHRARAIMPVHVYGRRMNVENIGEHTGLYVIEDLAEAHGILPSKRTTLACWSFYRNKIVHGEEGGAVACRDRGMLQLIEKMRCHNYEHPHDFYHEPRGFNYRLSNANAVLIYGNLSNFSVNLSLRKVVEAILDEIVPSLLRMPSRDVPWVYDMILPLGTNARAIVSELNRRGVPARHGFRPMSEQAEFRGHYKHLNAYKMSRRIIYFPIDPSLTRDTIETWVGTLLSLL